MDEKVTPSAEESLARIASALEKLANLSDDVIRYYYDEAEPRVHIAVRGAIGTWEQNPS